MSQKAALHTLGCRLNQAETAIIARNLQDKGFEIVDFGQPADLTVINTCTVTEQADAKCRQAVRKSIRSNPDTYVAVVGCYAQMAVDTIRQIDGVNMIVGNEHKMKLADYINGLQKSSEPVILHSPKISRNSFVIESVGLFDNATRANLKIQDGCNFVCSFCIIAKARGPARSRRFDDVIDEANKLVDMGHKEIVLTGVNIGTYQNDNKKFIDVLAALEKISGLERVRISSIELTTINRNVIDFMADSGKLCPYLHIPVQSGDDSILDSMRRKHDARSFGEIVEYAADKIPGIGLGTDVMVGYPGEGPQEYKNTKRLLADLPISFFHVFTYSDRKGTSSYKMPAKVDHAEKKRRYTEIAEMGKRKKFAFYKSFTERNLPVLFEEKRNGFWSGLTGNYIRVKVKSQEDLHNRLRLVSLDEPENDFVTGVIV